MHDISASSLGFAPFHFSHRKITNHDSSIAVGDKGDQEESILRVLQDISVSVLAGGKPLSLGPGLLVIGAGVQQAGAGPVLCMAYCRRIAESLRVFQGGAAALLTVCHFLSPPRFNARRVVVCPSTPMTSAATPHQHHCQTTPLLLFALIPGHCCQQAPERRVRGARFNSRQHAGHSHPVPARDRGCFCGGADPAAGRVRRAGSSGSSVSPGAGKRANFNRPGGPCRHCCTGCATFVLNALVVHRRAYSIQTLRSRQHRTPRLTTNKSCSRRCTSGRWQRANPSALQQPSERCIEPRLISTDQRGLRLLHPSDAVQI